MELIDFLIKAKINTYAGQGEGGEMKLVAGGKEFFYQEGVWRYRDRYFGFNPFIGTEIIWKNNQAVWGMNYYGEIISDKIDSKKVYQFLRQAMRLVQPDRPFRGPKNFQSGEWLYQDNSSGTIDKFNGMEMIYFIKDKVYELNYYGGFVSK